MVYFMGIFVKVINTPGVKGATSPNNPMDLIAFLEKKF